MSASDASADIWIVDDDRSVRLVLAAALREAGYAPREFGDAESALAALADATPALLYTDVRMPGISGLKLLERVALHEPHFPVIVMSAFTDIASTAAAYRHGAFDYLPKPFDLDQAVAAAGRALTHARAAPPASAEIPAPAAEPELIGQSAAMRELFRAIGRVAASGLGVLVTGETGTGKELVARALHRESRRASAPFVALNTAAIPAELLESELFGHEIGAFTGAARRHAGRFEQAAGGTLFLDEIGDMPLTLQTRLLRVLAAGEFYRVGGRELLRADARVIAATHQDLEAKVSRGEFRADLLHRLDVVRLHLPPLRERRADIPLLAEQFLVRAGAATGVAAKRFSPAALGALRDYAWPGNVRQLENLCQRLAALASGREIGVGDLPPSIVDSGARDAEIDWTIGLRAWAEHALASGATGIHATALAAFERVLLDAALTAERGHRQNAAKVLGLGRNTITRKLGSSRKKR
jgi:two-component system nitrogen regulation response regulator GlnG